MKLKRSQLREMILKEVRMANPAVSPMRSRAHPDFVRALKGESVERPHPHAVRDIISGLDQALRMPPIVGSGSWPPGTRSLNEIYPNLAQHLRMVRDYLNGKGLDPGDITTASIPSALSDTSMSPAMKKVLDDVGLTEEEQQSVVDALEGDTKNFHGPVFEKLDGYFYDKMPYDIKTGDEDPYEWVLDRLESLG